MVEKDNRKEESVEAMRNELLDTAYPHTDFE